MQLSFSSIALCPSIWITGSTHNFVFIITLLSRIKHWKPFLCDAVYKKSSFFLFFLITALFLVGSSGRPTWVRYSSATHSYQCVQYFCVSKHWYGCQCLGIFDMHTDAEACNDRQGLYGHGQSPWTWSESALKANSGEKHPLPHQGLEPTSVLHLAFSWMLYPVSYPHPFSSTFSRDHRIHQSMTGGHNKCSSLKTDRRDGIDKSIGDLILPHLPHNVKLRCSWLGDGHVCYFLQLKRQIYNYICMKKLKFGHTAHTKFQYAGILKVCRCLKNGSMARRYTDNA